MKLFVAFFVALFGSGSIAQAPRATMQSYTVVAKFPHDPKSYTQGLLWNGKTLNESSGQYGSSFVRETTLEGKVLQQTDINDKKVFAEGLALLNGKLYQLTWQEHIAFVYDAKTLKLEGKRTYATDGWGLTTDGKNLIMSDGTSTIYYLEPSTFKVLRKITVRNGSSEVSNVNELELINGEIWANIWNTDLIARINPQNGQVNAFVNMVGLRPDKNLENSDAVLNGIAYDAKNNRIFVTGKYWDTLYQIKVK